MNNKTKIIQNNNVNIQYLVNTLNNRISFVITKNYSNIKFFLKDNNQHLEQALAANKKIKDCFESFIYKYNDYILNKDTLPIKKLSNKEIEAITFIFEKEQDSIIEVMKDFNKLGKFSELNSRINERLTYNNKCLEELFDIFDSD